MAGTPEPREDLSLRPLLDEARKIAYRLLGIVEVLERELGINEGERNEDGG